MPSLMFAQAASEIPGSVWALGLSIGGGLVTAIGVLFRQLLIEHREKLAIKDQVIAVKDEAAKAIAAHRAEFQTILDRRDEQIGQLTHSVDDLAKVGREQREATTRNTTAIENLNKTTTDIIARALERKASSQSTPAVKV